MTPKVRTTAPRILIVDDDQNLRRTTAMILERKGYGVDTADGGLEAVEKVRDRTYDFILMDIKMPVMDGVEAHRRIRALEPGAVVVMMTAYAVDELVQQALADGAYGIIHKPLDIDKIIALIDSAKEAKRSALVLVVDDDPETGRLLKRILDSRGYRVATVGTGRQAIEAAQQRQHDIVLIDMKLPAMSGLDVYLAIREANPEAVAVMMTAFRQEMDELVDEALRNNAYACLYKPLHIETFLELVERVWAKQQADRDSLSSPTTDTT